MELDSLRARVLLLSCLCVAALATALLIGGGLRSMASPARFPATVRVVGLGPANATLAQEEVERALELARSSGEFRELLKGGFELAGAHPVLKCKVRAEDGVLEIEDLERIGVVLVSERDGERAYAVVHPDGSVEVSRGRLAIIPP